MITKKGNGENVPYLEIAEVVLVHCNICNNDYRHNSLVLIHKSFLHNSTNILPKNFIIYIKNP